uniref:Uncharacterized protein n=1 Tax=Daphnia galeata TaxID=27404 RepID=A0A8J2S4X0_9CRUS|nr:unnamed protein product [Daphnia galeata]
MLLPLDTLATVQHMTISPRRSAGQGGKIGGVGASTGPSVAGAAGSADLGPNTYDKTGVFHTGTPPPYGMAGNHFTSISGKKNDLGLAIEPGQRSQSGGQQNKGGSKPSYGGSYCGSN